MAYNCIICGKPLTDPISIKLGIGPICRITIKEKQAREKSGNLFSDSAQFTYKVIGNVIAITDLDKGRTVTNDIDNVIRTIVKETGINAYETKFIYKDTGGIWDGVNIGASIGFYSINETDFSKALAKIK